jgi:tungstate transport system substrate-binding protein
VTRLWKAAVSVAGVSILLAPLALAFADFVVSERGQGLIRSFGVARLGAPLFVPDAGKRPEALEP